VDQDQQLKSLCEQMDVETTLKQLAMYQTNNDQLVKDIEQDKEFVLGRLEAHYNTARV
jgi:hypothetical protein